MLNKSNFHLNLLEIDINEVLYPHQGIPLQLNASLKLQSGQVALLKGPTGCGKTTILHCINGIIPQVIEARLKGSIFHNGKQLARAEHIASTANPTTYTLLQNPFHSFIGVTNLFPPDINSGSEWMLERMRKYRSFHDLSAGERQRLLLKNAFQSNPDILLLDEPLSRLDENGKATFLKNLERRKQTRNGMTIIAEHHYEYLQNLIDVELSLKSQEYNSHSNNTDHPLNVKKIPQPDFSIAANANQYPANPSAVLVTLKDVSAKIAGQYLFHNVNLQIEAAQITGITGANGAGKTTLGKIIARRRKPSQGKVIPSHHNLKSAMLYEDPASQLFCDTVQAEIAFAAQNYNLHAKYPAWLLETFNLKTVAQYSPFHLSHGQQERAAFAALLSKFPSLIVLDEPTQGQDEIGAAKTAEIVKYMASLGRGIVILTHDMKFLQQTAHQIYRLHNHHLEKIA